MHFPKAFTRDETQRRERPGFDFGSSTPFLMTLTIPLRSLR